MHRARRLEDLGRKCSSRSARLRDAAVGLQPPLNGSERAYSSFVVLEVLTLWANFARFYFISCALGAKSPDGGRVQLGVAPFADEKAALAFGAKGEKNKSRGEPIWHDFDAFGRVMGKLNLADPTRLLTSLGYPSKVFDDLPPCRNFFAHRTQNTARKVKNVARRNGINPALPPSEVVCTPATGRSYPLVVDWLDDLTAIIEILAKP